MNRFADYHQQRERHERRAAESASGIEAQTAHRLLADLHRAAAERGTGKPGVTLLHRRCEL